MGQKNCPSQVAAAKRWISNYAPEFQGQPVTLLGDDLYSRQLMVEHCLESGMNFIFTWLPESHTALYDWLDYVSWVGKVKTLEISQWHKRCKEIYRYRYVNEIPLKDTQPTLGVNWCELTLTKYLLFDSWQHLIDFMLNDSPLSPSTDSS
ncbi:MAG: hypothetical protein V7K40_33140 [Nostoc sp.]|uniref:hypothetical protein n=1 Tax=Nostoc sp. TaxID=1180 RepID=UPI002FF5B5A2